MGNFTANEDIYESTDDEQFTNQYTGEIISKAELEKVLRINLVEKLSEANNNLCIIGAEPITLVTKGKKKRKLTEVKKDHHFCKTFRQPWRKIMNGKTVSGKPLSLYARAILPALAPYISFSSNMVQIDKRIPTHEELMKLCGMSKTSYYKAIKELEDNEIILRVKEAHGATAIYFNPFLMIAGYGADDETLMLFRNSKYVEGCDLFDR